MMHSTRIAILLLASASIAACSGDGSGIGSGDSDAIGRPDDGGRSGTVIALRAATAEGLGGPGGLTTEDGGGGSLDIVAARVIVRDIELDFADDDLDCAALEEELAPPVSCDDDETIVIEGPFEVDLLTGEATPSLEGLTIPAAEYRRVDVRIQSDDGPSFEAITELDGDVSSAHIALDFTEDARFESEDGVLLDGDAGTLLVRLDVDAWFSGVPLTRCIDDGDVEIQDDHAVIDEDTSGGGDCSDIENELKDNIKDSGELVSS